jgi:hypothetical protein
MAIGLGALIRGPKETIGIWKIALIAFCGLLPAIMNALVSLVYPVFVDRYLLFLMPYWTVLAAIGMVSPLTLDRFKTAAVLSGVLLIAIVYMSVAVDISYYNYFRKEDWRAAAQFISRQCPSPDNLRLYMEDGVEGNATYYNPTVGDTLNGWSAFLRSKPDNDKVRAFLPKGYIHVCLVLSHLHKLDQPLVTNLRDVLSERYSKMELHTYHGINVEVYHH